MCAIIRPDVRLVCARCRAALASRARLSRTSRAVMRAIRRSAAARGGGPVVDSRFSFSDLKFDKLDTIMAIHIDQIRETMALIPLLGIRIHPHPPIAVDTPIRSTTRSETPSSDCTKSPDEISTNGFSTSSWPETNFPAKTAAAAAA
ncbi:hypothetical protein F511_46327 [Dorcoceras hygrometricum]|uniref:Uncharacterized protein n=1 Tax=Dorcoceras hygrometricum TaxID=472368 RepID=A0A2Z6ZUA9_9LAMI|nr:hypothetical protein F511_46327 [Dorcoceras hygrometricum]